VSETNPISPTAVHEAVDQALAAVTSAATLTELRALRSAHLGEASTIAELNAKMRDVPNNQKAETGKLMGQAKGTVEQAFILKETELGEREAAEKLTQETVDVTLAPRRARVGARHPLAQLQEDIADIFVAMGWEVADVPEVEQ
jgi:phenylalanyl-tRNA synthetase alpha chain